MGLVYGSGLQDIPCNGGSRFIGVVDGGSGYDRVVMDDPAGGNFGSSRNFEWLEVRQGAWTLTGTGDFSDGGAVRNGATLINQGSIAAKLIDAIRRESSVREIASRGAAATTIPSPKFEIVEDVNNRQYEFGNRSECS